jgi:hypothetical protein
MRTTLVIVLASATGFAIMNGFFVLAIAAGGLIIPAALLGE